MQQNDPNITLITATAPLSAATHGGRAKCLQRLIRLDLPVPCTVALSFDAVHAIAAGNMPDMQAILTAFDTDDLLCVRPSSEDPDWGGPRAILNIGMNDNRYQALRSQLGHEAAAGLYIRFVQSYAVHVARLDPDMFDTSAAFGPQELAQALQAYEAETEEEFPQDPAVQLAEVLRSMARAWEGVTARLLRQAKGAPVDAKLGLVVQKMALSLGQGASGSGVFQMVSSVTGLPKLTGHYFNQSQGRKAAQGEQTLYLERDPRGPSLEDLVPEAFEALKQHSVLMRSRLREEMQIEFMLQDGKL
ncbi:MAG TPA: pyruvate, phosphate dikinase, partial [Rhodobacteraceae bacterium]|nr:pyruvate, phosphate dikinase [Paracoccaceae bacterium]